VAATEEEITGDGLLTSGGAVAAAAGTIGGATLTVSAEGTGGLALSGAGGGTSADFVPLFLAPALAVASEAAGLGFAALGALGAPEAGRVEDFTRMDVRRAASFLKSSRLESSTALRGVAA
jgi:hypothetical protein